MKRMYAWMFTAVLICGASVFTSCTDKDDPASTQPSLKEELRAQYGENKKIIRSGHAVELTTVFKHPEIKDAAGRAFDETFSRTMRRMWVQFAKTGNPSLTDEESPDGKAKVWPLYDTTNKEVMVFDEFNIHTEKESGLKIVEWNLLNTLTKYYCI